MNRYSFKKFHSILASKQKVITNAIFIQFLVYLYHIAGLIVCLYSPTDLHRSLFIEHHFSQIHFIILIIVALIFYNLTCQGPGFVTYDSTPFIQDDYTSHCSICRINQPLRSTHCKKCGRCVIRRDHHCPWLGTCVGRQNHFFFVVYLFFDTIVFFLFVKQTYPLTKLNNSNFFVWLMTSFLGAVLCFFGVFGFLQTLCLLPFHIFLILTNKTTWESLKSTSIPYMKDWTSSISPFSQGLFQNIREFVTMRWNHPTYQFPSGARYEKWKNDNSFLVNDSYECC